MFADSKPELNELLDRLDACLDDATTLDPRAESDAAIAKALERLPRLRARLDAIKVSVTGEFDTRNLCADDNIKTTKAWLRNRCRMTPEDAARQARHARHLRELPATAKALAAGEISSAVVQRIIGAHNRRTSDALHRDENKIIGWAREQHFEEFCQTLARWQEDNDPDGAFRDRAEGRRFHCSRTFQDGYRLDGWLDPINGTIFDTELAQREKSCSKPTGPKHKPASDASPPATTCGAYPNSGAPTRSSPWPNAPPPHPPEHAYQGR